MHNSNKQLKALQVQIKYLLRESVDNRSIELVEHGNWIAFGLVLIDGIRHESVHRTTVHLDSDLNPFEISNHVKKLNGRIHVCNHAEDRQETRQIQLD